MTEKEVLKQWIEESDNIVFFGGAGVSTESGIPDFRSRDGLYHQEYQYPPETIISHSFYQRNPEEFFRFYKNKMEITDAKPNKAHLALARLEQQGKLKAVITQNIDGLHQMAGSREVLELHGSIHRNYCAKCGKFYGLADVLIVGGTSLVVYPAAGLIDYYEGSKLVLINKSETGRDSQADLVIREPIGQVFDEILER